MLQEKSIIVPINNEPAELVRLNQQKMKDMNVESLVESGKINIYPKKNTIDLKKHLGKKSAKLEKKTEKSIIYLAKQLMLNKQKNSNEEVKEQHWSSELLLTKFTIQIYI